MKHTIIDAADLSKLYAPCGGKRKAKMVSPAWSITLTVPCQVRSTANLREHWAPKKRRKDAEKAALAVAFNNSGITLAKFPGTRYVVTLTKLGGRGMDDDNLANAFKGIRDWIAGWLGIDDGDSRVTWRYEQEPGGEVGVKVVIFGRETR